jgi:hypothetical protein
MIHSAAGKSFGADAMVAARHPVEHFPHGCGQGGQKDPAGNSHPGI